MSLEQLAVIARWLSLALLIGATCLYAYQFILKRESLAKWARVTTGVGFLMLTAAIGMKSSVTDGTRLDGANVLVLSAWALVLLYFIVEHLIKIKSYGAVLVPTAVVLLVVGQLMPGSAKVSPLVENWKIGIHVALIVFANAGFLIAGAASALYVAMGRQLKQHKTATLFKRLPSLANTQKVAMRAVSFAFPAYTAGMTLGILRAMDFDLAGWWRDPRIMVSGFVWLCYATYLVLTYRHSASGKRVSWIAMVGVVLVIIVAILARTDMAAGFHNFAS